MKIFCPKCGSLLMPKKEENRKVMVCSCGYKTTNTKQAVVKEILGKKEKELEVIEKGELDILPETTIECPKCGNKKAKFWTMQTRAGDEPETKFLRCTKCSHTWRDYG